MASASPVARGKILRQIAARSDSNLRLLQGALTRVVALSSLTASEITPDAIDRALPPGPAGDHPTPKATLPEIQEAVCDHLDIPLQRLLSPTRTAPAVRARQLAMYLARDLTDLSLPAIAAGFNRRDHTTVIHAIRRVETALLKDPSLSRTLDQLRDALTPEQIDRDRTD